MTFLLGMILGGLLVFAVFWYGIAEVHQPTKKADLFAEIDRLYDKAMRKIERG